MNPPFPKKKFKTFDDNDEIESLKKEQEEAKLSLRKKHIINILLTKRQSMLIDPQLCDDKYKRNFIK